MDSTPRYGTLVYQDENITVYEEIYTGAILQTEARRYYWKMNQDKNLMFGPFDSSFLAIMDFDNFHKNMTLLDLPDDANVIRVDFQRKRRIS